MISGLCRHGSSSARTGPHAVPLIGGSLARVCERCFWSAKEGRGFLAFNLNPSVTVLSGEIEVHLGW
jgi:hypothetical protein